MVVNVKKLPEKNLLISTRSFQPKSILAFNFRRAKQASRREKEEEDEEERRKNSRDRLFSLTAAEKGLTVQLFYYYHYYPNFLYIDAFAFAFFFSLFVLLEARSVAGRIFLAPFSHHHSLAFYWPQQHRQHQQQFVQ